MKDQQRYRIARKEAVTMDVLISEYIKEMKLASGLNSQLIFKAWDNISGAGQFTLKKYLKNEILYCTISSSVVRNRLSFQKASILEEINKTLEKEPLFSDMGTPALKAIILK